MSYRKDLKIKEDYEILFQELIAYLELTQNSEEHIYYKKELLELESIIENWDCKNTYEKHKKIRNRLYGYNRKMYYKKLKPLSNIKKYVPWWAYGYNWDKDERLYWDRCYINSKFYKNLSNRLVRKSPEDRFKLKGSSYKKVYDYQWCIS